MESRGTPPTESPWFQPVSDPVGDKDLVYGTGVGTLSSGSYGRDPVCSGVPREDFVDTKERDWSGPFGISSRTYWSRGLWSSWSSRSHVFVESPPVVTTVGVGSCTCSGPRNDARRSGTLHSQRHRDVPPPKVPRTDPWWNSHAQGVPGCSYYVTTTDTSTTCRRWSSSPTGFPHRVSSRTSGYRWGDTHSRDGH